MSQVLYKKVVDSLLDQIGSGDIKVGQRLPSEEIYAEQLGVSRSTLRLAFTQLEQKGIIRRRKRGGTDVISDKPVPRFDLVGGSVIDLMMLSKDSTYLVQEVKQCTHRDSEDLANYLDVANRWTCFSGVRLASEHETPFGCANCYVPEHYAELAIEPGDRIASVFGSIEKQYDISVARVNQYVSATTCPAQYTSTLGLETNEAALSMKLEMRDKSDRIMLCSFTYFDPARVNLNAEIRIED